MSTEPQRTTGAPDDDRTRPLPTSAVDAPTDAPTRTTADEPAVTSATTVGRDPVAKPEPARTERGPRVGTVVWGLVLAVLGVGVLAWAGGRRIDVDVASIVLVAGAGVALRVGSILSGLRRRR